MYRQEHDGPLAELLGWTCIKTDLAVNMGLRTDPANQAHGGVDKNRER